MKIRSRAKNRFRIGVGGLEVPRGTVRLWRRRMPNRLGSVLSLLATLCFISPAAFAAAWGAQTIITGYYIYDGGGAYIRLENMQNPDGCQSNGYLVLSTGAPYFEAIWAQVIAAQATGTTVQVHYYGCAGIYPLIDAIAVPAIW